MKKANHNPKRSKRPTPQPDPIAAYFAYIQFISSLPPLIPKDTVKSLA